MKIWSQTDINDHSANSKIFYQPKWSTEYFNRYTALRFLYKNSHHLISVWVLNNKPHRILIIFYALIHPIFYCSNFFFSQRFSFIMRHAYKVANMFLSIHQKYSVYCQQEWTPNQKSIHASDTHRIPMLTVLIKSTPSGGTWHRR